MDRALGCPPLSSLARVQRMLSRPRTLPAPPTACCPECQSRFPSPCPQCPPASPSCPEHKRLGSPLPVTHKTRSAPRGCGSLVGTAWPVLALGAASSPGKHLLPGSPCTSSWPISVALSLLYVTHVTHEFPAQSLSHISGLACPRRDTVGPRTCVLCGSVTGWVMAERPCRPVGRRD